MSNVAFDSPVGDLEWAFIDGEGKKDLNGTPKYTIDLVLSPEQAEPLIARLEQFWEENKPKGVTKPKSMGYRPHAVKDEAASKEEGEPVYVETGKTAFTFKTNIEYASGDPKIIKIFNAKGNEVSLQGKKIGNGSRGRVGGVMGIYNINKNTCGVALYLNTVQLSKFVPFTGGSSFAGAVLEDEDGDGFDGVGEMGGIPDDAAQDAPAKPRL